MRNATIAGTVTLLLALCAIPCVAQDRYEERNLPRGDYAQTCRSIHMEGDRLEAECQKRDGDWRRSSIDDVDRCGGRIINDNGHLTCPQGGSGYGNGNGNDYHFSWRNGVPAGNYVQSCRNIRAKGYALAADCQKRDGGWRNTSLYNFDQCTGAIGNDDGHLTCPKDGSGGGYVGGNGYRFGWQNGLPTGSYVQSCRNIRAKGYALAADCQTGGGSWRNTSLYNFDQCTSAIANDDGHLVCPR